MSQVKLDLASMSAAEKTQFAITVGQMLIANESTFPDQPVPGADLIDFAVALTDTMGQADVARATWHELISTQQDMLGTLDGYLRQVATYVQSVSHGQAAIIELAGLNVRHAAGRIGQLPAPEGFIAVSSTNPGTVKLKWKPVKRARNYVIQYTAAAVLPPAFHQQVPVTRTKLVLTGLASGTKYWFRAAAINAAGLSPWTNAVAVVTQ
jgi:hypothetical protein